MEQPAECLITPEYHAELQDEFAIWASESGADREYDFDHSIREYEWISDKLETPHWVVMGENNLLTQINESNIDRQVTAKLKELGEL